MLKKYCAYHHKWRMIVSNYLVIPADESKRIFNQIFHGCNPPTDLPFLWQLKHEVFTATEYLLSLDENKDLDEVLNSCDNPKASKFAHMIAAEENNVLVGILSELEQHNLKPLCLLFDGAMIETNDEG